MSKLDTWRKTYENHLDMRYNMPKKEQHTKEETRKENQLQATNIRDESKRPGFKVKFVPLVISAFGGGIKKVLKELDR